MADSQRVAHVSIIHGPGDTRIYARQCRTLAEAGHEVHLIVGGTPSEERDGIRFHSLSRGWQRPRLRHQWPLQVKALTRAWGLGADVYHLHDPHLIPMGVVLRLRGARVVYDVHEHYPAHALEKLKGRPIRAQLKSGLWRGLESMARRWFDGFVCVSDGIAARFPAERTRVLHNYPPPDEQADPVPYAERPPNVVFLGTLAPHRGQWQALASIGRLPEELGCKLLFVGRFGTGTSLAAAQRHPAWALVEYVPWLPRPAAVAMLQRARIGLVAFPATRNQLSPEGNNKLYEYMAAGLPVITSDAPAWRRLVEETGCGLTADASDPEAIAAAIEHLLTNPVEAEEMGRRGQAAVASRFNWKSEEPRLLALYGSLNGG